MKISGLIDKINIWGNGKLSKKVTALIVAFSLLIVISVSVALFFGTRGIVAEEMNKANASILSQLEQHIDTVLVDSVYSIINDSFIDFGSNEPLTDFFYTNNCSMKSYYHLIEFVSDVDGGNDFIDSIYIYSARNGTAVSSYDGLVKDALLNNYSNVPLIHQALKNSNERRFWITPSDNRNNVITCVQQVPIMNYEKSEGFVAININVESIVKSANNNWGESCDIAVVLPDGKLLGHSNDEWLSEGVLGVDKNSDFFKNPFGSTTEKLGGKPYSIIWKQSNKSDMKYAILFPEGGYNSRVRILILYCLGIVIAMLLVAIIAAYYLARLIMKPFYSNAVYLESKLVHDIIHSSSVNGENINNRLNILDTTLEYDKFYLITFMASKYVFDNFDLAERERKSDISFEIIKDRFKRKGNAIGAKESLYEFTIVFNTSYGRMEIVELCRSVLNELKEKVKIACNAAVSEACYKIEHINNSYSSVHKALEYGYIFGYDNVFDFLEFQKMEARFSGLSTKQLKDMEGWLRVGDIKRFGQMLESVFEAIKERTYSISGVKYILVQIVAVVQRIGDEKELFGSSKESSLCFSYFDKIESLEEFSLWINILLEQFEETVQSRKLNRHKDLIDRVGKYIVENIGVEITLNNVAAAMNISPNYLSKIFKEERGISFSNFLSEKKLEKAEELLVETRMSVAEIVRIVGYSNEAYFTKLFRMKYSDTPGAYRKKKKAIKKYEKP